MAFLLQCLETAKSWGADHYMECSARRCQGLREVLEELARTALRHKSLPPLVREEREEAARKEQFEEVLRKRRKRMSTEVIKSFYASLGEQ